MRLDNGCSATVYQSFSAQDIGLVSTRPGTSAPKRTVRRGVAALEAALALPLALLLMFGTWELGRIIEVRQMLDSAVRDGARRAASGQFTNAQVQQAVANYARSAGLPITNLVVTVSDLTTPGVDVSAASPLDKIQVQATLPFKDVRWAAAILVTNSNTTLSSSAIWYSAKAQSYPSNASVPQGY
jgi:Flp pilus assembly protein TadG